MSWKKMILGEQMPDKNDPKYRERYEKEVNAGRRFASFAGIDRLAVKVQKFVYENKVTAFMLLIGFFVLLITVNIMRMVRVCTDYNVRKTATQIQEEQLNERIRKMGNDFGKLMLKDIRNYL